MNSDMELKASLLESNVFQIFEKVRNIKKELQEVKLDLVTLISSDEYKEVKEFFKSTSSKRKEEAKDTASSSSGTSLSKKPKLQSKEEQSTTDSPYYSYKADSGWQNIADDTSKRDFMREDNYVVVYTDGACENNGKANAKAGIGVWFGDRHPLNVSRPVNGKATNNTAEIQACVIALELLYNEGIRRVRLKTDSKFTINCITAWINKWKKNNWKVATGADVKNKEDLVKLDNIRNKMDDVDWVHVRGHQGERGNEEADKLAKTGANLYKS